MNVFKVVWTTYVIRAVGEKLIRDFERFINEYPREYERTSRMFRQFSERVDHAYKEMWG